MSWNYRVIRKTTYMGTKTYHSYNLYEVYYDERGRVQATSEEPIVPAGENIIELMRDLCAMFKAFALPILEWDLVFRRGLEPSMHELKEAKTITHPWTPPSKEEIQKIEVEIDRTRILAETIYKKECCNKTPKEIISFLGNLPVTWTDSK